MIAKDDPHSLTFDDLDMDLIDAFRHRPIPVLSESMNTSAVTSLKPELQLEALSNLTSHLAHHLSKNIETVRTRLPSIEAALAHSLAVVKVMR